MNTTTTARPTYTLTWTRDEISGAHTASAGAWEFAITPNWTRGARGARQLSQYVVTHNDEIIARVQADEKAPLTAAKRWANSRYTSLLEQSARRSEEAARKDAAEMSVVDRYVAKLETMTQVQLMDELELCVRQNHYGSHDAQTRLVRAELGQRCSH